MPTVKIMGVFDSGKKAARGINAIRKNDLGSVTAYSPVPDHALDHALERSVSPIRLFILIGGIIGCISGFALPIYTVYDWPLITGGKALISLPPFVVIAFELTILFGALSGMMGFLILARLPRVSRRTKVITVDPTFSLDRFGVFVSCDPKSESAVREALKLAGALEASRGA